MTKLRKFERGAVSLFIVIFSALLITTITVGFVRIMMTNQQQASMNDLSKSALDSAYAGVEDAKRALVEYRKACPAGPSTSGDCTAMANVMDGSNCEALQQLSISVDDPDTKDVIIKQDISDEDLAQAYTCVKIKLDTENFIGRLDANTSQLIPLIGKTSFDTVKVEWYSQSDLNQSGSSALLLRPNITTLPEASTTAWPENTPALMRAQLIQYGDDFNLSDFDKNTNNASLFLFPVAGAITSAMNFADDARLQRSSLSSREADCADGRQYACSATITLPNPFGATPANRHAYLRLSGLYNSNATSFSVTLLNAGSVVNFSGVQPTVDSTGRANDLFKRISARLKMDGGTISTVDAAADITGSLCKSFYVMSSGSTVEPCTE